MLYLERRIMSTWHVVWGWWVDGSNRGGAAKAGQLLQLRVLPLRLAGPVSNISE